MTGNHSTTSSLGKQGACRGPTMNAKQQTVKNKENTPNPAQTPKTHTSPSIEHTNPPPKRLIMEDNTMEVDVKANQDNITRSNTETVQDSTNATNVTRSNNLDVNNSDTRSNVWLVKVLWEATTLMLNLLLDVM